MTQIDKAFNNFIHFQFKLVIMVIKNIAYTKENMILKRVFFFFNPRSKKRTGCTMLTSADDLVKETDYIYFFKEINEGRTQ